METTKPEIITSFELEPSSDPIKSAPWIIGILQRKRTVYYEDVVNPSGYRDSLVCLVKTQEMADKILSIFNENPFTTEWHSKNRLHWNDRLELTNNPPNGRTKYQIFSVSESKVRGEQDYYNGTDQSRILYQLMPDKTGRYSAKSTKEEVCRFWNMDYAPVVIELHCKRTKTLMIWPTQK